MSLPSTAPWAAAFETSLNRLQSMLAAQQSQELGDGMAADEGVVGEEQPP